MIRIALIALLCSPALAFAQERFATRDGQVTFYSETKVENIEAVNHKASTVLDVTTGQVQASMLIKVFEFKKALMQEHFNENYMESNTYPKAEFKGKVSGFTTADAATPGTYEVTLDGELDVHGVKQPRTLKATFLVSAGGSMKAASEFMVKPAEHGIKIPGGVNVAEEIKVTLDMDLKKM